MTATYNFATFGPCESRLQIDKFYSYLFLTFLVNLRSAVRPTKLSGYRQKDSLESFDPSLSSVLSTGQNTQTFLH